VTTIQPQSLAVGRYRFANVVGMEWVKLRSLRSTWLTLAVTVVGAVGIALDVGRSTENASGDLTNDVLAGIAPGLLLTGVLGVMVMTSESSSGMIRLTLAAAPHRRGLLAAKAAVFAAVAMVVGEVAAFLAFFVGRAALPDSVSAPELSQPGVLRALVLAGAGYCLIGLVGLGLGAVIRHTPAAIGVLVAGVYVGAQLFGLLAESAMGYAPVSIVANSLSVADPLPEMPSPWTGLGVLCLYAALALGIGGWLLERRDA
jgi:ABC-type transport system involved in multi-copper enzyme maturation permease subunit